jgi:hypothetical protein
MFERTFRVTRTIADMLLLRLGATNAFFVQRNDALGSPGICPKVKLLMALQLLAYGCSPSAFQAYYQMGITTARECMKNFCRSLVHDTELQSIYLRNMTRADAKRVTDMHQEQHGIAGMVGSLDCMHVGWKNCPVAWQGQEQGKEGHPTIVLEALGNYNLWFWHVSFGWAGTLNDINIWERSPLLEAFIDGTWRDDIDFTFTVGDKEFNRLWLTTDGIYPELARFVKTVQEPIDEKSKAYASWQEATRKDIERAFGVLQQKFHVLVRKFEQWFIDDISNVVLACIMLHNMMVAHRMSKGEEEGVSFYDCPDIAGEEVDIAGEEVEDHDTERADVDRRNAEIALLCSLESEVLGNDPMRGTSLFTMQQKNAKLNKIRHQYAHRRWEQLYNVEEHHRLRQAIMEQLLVNRLERQSAIQAVFNNNNA